MQGEFQILSLSGSCLVGDDGHHHHKNAMCSLILTDDKGKASGSAPVISLIAAGPVGVNKSYLIYGMSSDINSLYH